MAFTQLELNYAIEYSKAMANAYPYWSYFSDLYGSPNSATYKPVSGKAVAVQSMTTSGARAVNRDQITGTFNRNFNTSEQILTIVNGTPWPTQWTFRKTPSSISQILQKPLMSSRRCRKWTLMRLLHWQPPPQDLAA